MALDGAGKRGHGGGRYLEEDEEGDDEKADDDDEDDEDEEEEKDLPDIAEILKTTGVSEAIKVRRLKRPAVTTPYLGGPADTTPRPACSPSPTLWCMCRRR